MQERQVLRGIYFIVQLFVGKKRRDGKMKKKLLAIAVAAAAGAALCGITADAAVYQLDEIIVNGDKYTDDTIMPGGKTDRRIHFGLYGNMDLMDVPANIASYTEKTIKQNYIPARTFMNTVTNNPSIMVGGASTNNNVELQIRGSAFNTHDMTMDGLPGMMAMGIIPMNWVEKIDVVTGPNIVLSGTGINQSVSGYINFVPKIAKDKPILAISETYSSRSIMPSTGDSVSAMIIVTVFGSMRKDTAEPPVSRMRRFMETIFTFILTREQNQAIRPSCMDMTMSLTMVCRKF